MVQLFVALVVVLSAQAAGREGTVVGTLMLNGRATTLTHVYASAQPGAFDKNTEDIRVLFSDVPLLDDTREDVFALVALARQGKGRILEVVLDASGSAISGAIYAPEFNGMVSVTGMHVFTREVFDTRTVSGRMSIDGSREFQGVTWRYDARFRAPIPRPLSENERRAALAGAPAVVADAYVAAIRNGDMTAFSRLLAGQLSPSVVREQFDLLRAEMPRDSRPSEVVPQTDGSVLVAVEGHRDGVAVVYRLKMVMEAGEWRVGQ